MRARGILPLVVALAAAASACAHQTDPELAKVDAVYATAVSHAPAEARNMGASPQQLAVLDRLAAERRAPTFDEYRTVVDRTLTCMREAGLDVTGPVDDVVLGIRMLSYRYGPSDRVAEANVLAIADPCINTHSYVVEFLWQTQPDTARYEARMFASYRSKIVACLREHGVTVRSDAPAHEVLEASRRLSNRSSAGSASVDCETETGFVDAIS